MRISHLMFFVAVYATNLLFAQDGSTSEESTQPSDEVLRSYVVQLTEFRLLKTDDSRHSTSDILTAFEQDKSGDVEIIETMHLSALDGIESMVQCGKIVSATSSRTISPGRAPLRQTERQPVGTLVNVTAKASNGKIFLKLTYESSRLENNATDESPSDTNTFTVNTTLEMDTKTTVIAGGSSAGTGVYLAVSLSEQRPEK